MKTFVAVVLCVVLVNGELSKEFQDKVKAEVTEVGKKCMESAGANEDDIAELMQRKSPSRKQGKCLLSCFDKAFGAQSEDGKFTKEGILKSLEPYKAEDEAIYDKFVKLLVDVCLPEVKSADACEAAAEMDACYHKNADDDIKKADAVF